MPKLWKLAPAASEEYCKKFSNLSTLGAQLLFNRGIADSLHAQKFLLPKYEELHDPFLFLDMKKAVDRIWQALEKDEGICIYGDYDADAVTANAVLQQTFRYLGKQVGSYIPDRFTEGYGLNIDAFKKIRDEGCKVVVTVDCGTNSTDVAEFCKENGLDLIITDHHEIIGPVPESFALINPKNPADTYPYQDITGVGVAFKLACGLLADSQRVQERLERNNLKFVASWEKWLLDLVAIGTVADCHSLLGENRILVKFGLRVLPKTKWNGLRSLFATAGLDFSQRPPDTYTLGFILAPRLNAAGRLEHADTALHLLLEENPVTAFERAEGLEAINARRQDQTLRIVSEAKEAALQYQDRKVLVLAHEGWSKGIVGLVAGRLVEEFHKPVVVLEKTQEESTGSARTVGEFNIVEALKYAGEFLTRFGGHKQAAGLTLKTEHLERFYQKMLEYAETRLLETDLQQVLELEAELHEGDLVTQTLELLNSLEPFGVGNPKPKFLICNSEIQAVRIVGSLSQHLQIKLKVGHTVVPSIYFNVGDFAKSLKIGDTIDVAAELSENIWNGKSSLQLRIADIRKAQRDTNIQIDANDTNSTYIGITKSDETKLIYPELSYTITGLLQKIHNDLGQYAREKQYGDALESKLKESNISYVRELQVGDSGNILDFVVENKIAVELKAKRIITKDDYIQTQRYLQETHLRLGLLVNFRDKYIKPKRIVRIENTTN